MSEYTQGTISFDDVQGASEFVGEGKFICTLGAATGGLSKTSQKPMVTAVWEVAEGDKEGYEIYDYYSMGISQKDPNKAPFSYGLAKLRGDLKAVNDPAPKGFQFPTVGGPSQEVWHGDADKAAAILGKKMRGKRVEIQVVKEPRKNREGVVERDEQGNPRFNFRPRILGLANRGTTADAGGDDLGL